MSITQTYSDSIDLQEEQEVPSLSHRLRKRRIWDFIDKYDWSGEFVQGLDGLVDDIATASRRETVYAGRGKTDWYDIVKRHIKPGNYKVAKNTWIWNISPATDCPNLGTERCQVPKSMCYAYQNEREYTHSEDSPGGPLHAKRRQTVIWDLLDPETFSEILVNIHENKTGRDIEFFRLNEAGDFRNMHDVHKFNELSRLLAEKMDIVSYVYTASSHLDWQDIGERHFTLNASNDMVAPYADKRFAAFERGEFEESKDIVMCPFEATDGDIECGDCTRCMNPKLGDTAIHIH